MKIADEISYEIVVGFSIMISYVLSYNIFTWECIRSNL